MAQGLRAALIHFALLAAGMLASVAGATAAPDPPAASLSPDLQHAIDQFRPGRRLWIEGDFGDFHGHATQAGPSGLIGLRPDRAWIGKQPEFESLEWNRILRVHQQVTSARNGAVTGGIVGVLAGALAGLFVPTDHGWLLETQEARQDTARGALIGGAVGVVTGWCVGSAIHRWRTIYNRVSPQGS